MVIKRCEKMSKVAIIPIKRNLSIIKKHWALIASIGVLWITVTVLLIFSIRQNQGHLVYALDDPYIHMAIAKNFAQHGIWGITKYGFTSSSSSLLWTLLLSSIYFFVGVIDVTTFILNVIFATITICLVYVLLRQYELPTFYTFVALLSIIFFTPLIALIFSGMEHTLHILITIPFVYISAKILSKEKSTLLESSSLLLLAPLVTMARYEGLFLILVICTLFIIRKRLLYSSFLFVLAIIPIAIYGMISISNGWDFLPNSVLLKGNTPMFSLIGIAKFFYHFSKHMMTTPHILILVMGALILFIFQFNKQKTLWKDSTVMLIIFTATTFLHMLFARTGWFFRYEAYLVALGIFVIAIAMRGYLPKKISIEFDKSLIPKYVAIVLCIFLVISPFAVRGFMSLKRTSQATTNIYEQQYQMGSFLKQFYQEESVAANDIGAINYLADIKCLDLWGLGSLEVARTKRDGGYDTQKVYNLAKQNNIKIAIVYDHWFEGNCEIPSEWIKVGEWEISNNVCGGDTVSLYAVDPEGESKLIENLRIFSPQLPKDIKQSGKYIDTKKR
jgi:hypothetical protein